MNSLHANDRVVLIAILLMVAAAIAYGVGHGNAGFVAAVGALLAVAALGTALWSQAGTASTVIMPVLGMAVAGLVIHAARGQAEAHFAVFAFLACTTVYRRWEAVLAGAAAIAVHHLTFNYFQQWGWGAVCFTEPGLGKVVEHALYVVAEAAMLILLARRSQLESRSSSELMRITDGIIASDGSIAFESSRLQMQSRTAIRLQGALNHIEAALVRVRTSAASMRSAADEIATGNQDLSSRTEQTAGNLQQAASAIEELSSTVNQTADSARTANQLASSASEVARRGGEVVSQVVSTMNEINASSKKIGDIIGVIDGIAFQTNILALNAAVEAARAGEQGRGFAVVAGEVRSLAQRSAEAAREIKSLIGASVEKVESGSRLVQDAGSTMTEIVASVQRVSDIIGEISAAAGEQSAGIGQVNNTVNQLDQATQQNAALVEESAAAAESLKEQAAQLSAVVAEFRLHADKPPATVTAGPAPKQVAQKVIAQARTAAKPAPAPAPATPAAGKEGDWETF